MCNFMVFFLWKCQKTKNPKGLLPVFHENGEGWVQVGLRMMYKSLRLIVLIFFVLLYKKIVDLSNEHLSVIQL